MIFTGWQWHLKTDGKGLYFREFCLFVHEWRMPLLYYMAGGSVFISLKSKSSAEFIKERFLRLGIPLVFGTLFLIPPQVYIERKMYYNSFIEFYPFFFSGIYPEGNFFWHHLWFLGYLLCYSLLLVTMVGIGYLSKKLMEQSPDSYHPYIERVFQMVHKFPGAGKRAFLFTPPIFLLSSQLLLRPIYPGDTYRIYDDLANFSYFFLYFLFGYLAFKANNFSSDSLMENLFFSILMTLVLFYWYYNFLDYREDIPEFFRLFLKFSIKSGMGWFWTQFFMGLGDKFLNREYPITKKFKFTIYPIYILHQTFIVVIGFYVLQIRINEILQFSLIVLITFILSISSSQMIIKNSVILSFFFGIKGTSKNS